MVLKDKFGVPMEPEDDIIVAYDWQENPIYENDGENYFKTDIGYLFDDLMAEDIRDYFITNFGRSKPIQDWMSLYD